MKNSKRNKFEQVFGIFSSYFCLISKGSDFHPALLLQNTSMESLLLSNSFQMQKFQITSMVSDSNSKLFFIFKYMQNKMKPITQELENDTFV
jgi:hypothetical protein